MSREFFVNLVLLATSNTCKGIFCFVSKLCCNQTNDFDAKKSGHCEGSVIEFVASGTQCNQIQGCVRVNFWCVFYTLFDNTFIVVMISLQCFHGYRR